MSKPTWSHAFGRASMSAFFVPADAFFAASWAFSVNESNDTSARLVSILKCIARYRRKPERLQEYGRMASKKDRLAKRISPNSVRINFTTEPDDLTEQRIRMQAFEVYERRRDTGGAGDSVSDWLCAESELNPKAASLNNDRSAPSRANA